MKNQLAYRHEKKKNGRILFLLMLRIIGVHASFLMFNTRVKFPEFKWGPHTRVRHHLHACTFETLNHFRYLTDSVVIWSKVYQGKKYAQQQQAEAGLFHKWSPYNK